MREKIGEGYVEARLDTSRLSRDTETMQRDIESRFARVGQKMQETGRTLTRRMTLPIVAAGAAIVKLAGDYEASMNRVGALTGATGTEFERLEQTAQELGRTTMFSAAQVADGMGFLAMAGFEVNEIIGAMPGVLQLAAAAQIDLASAADIASNVLTGYNMEVSELGHANDVLAKAMTSANTDLRQLGEAMKYAGPVASAAGVSFEDAAAAIALMGNAGIQGGMAGTSLRGAISRLLNPVGAASAALDRLGISALDAEGNVRPLDEIVRQLDESGASAGDMMQIFGLRAGPAMAALVSQGAEALAELRGELENSGGTAQAIADRQMEGFRGALIRMKSAFEGAAIAIANSGLLSGMANFAELLARGFQWLAEVNPAILNFGVLLAGAAAAVGPVMWAVDGLMSSYAKLAGLLRTVTAAMSAATAAKGALALSSTGVVGGITSMIASINPAILAVVALGVAAWGIKSAMDASAEAQVSAADAAAILAESAGVAYGELSTTAAAAGDEAEMTAQRFYAANADIIESLRSLSQEAQQDMLIQIGWQLVHRGTPPEEAFAAVQRLADATDVDLDLTFDETAFTDLNSYLDSISTRLQVAQESAGFWTNGLKQGLEEVGQEAAHLFSSGDMEGAFRVLAEAEAYVESLGKGTSYTAKEVHRLIEAFAEGTGIDGLGGWRDGIHDLDGLMSGLADGTLRTSAQMREFIITFIELTEAGVPTEEALSAAATATGDVGTAAAGAAPQVDEFGNAIEDVEEDVKSATDAMQDHLDMIMALADPWFAAQQASQRLAEAQKAVTDAVKEHGTGSAEHLAALRNETEAALGAYGAEQRLSAALEDGTTSAAQHAALMQMLQEEYGLSGAAANVAAEDVRQLQERLGRTPTSQEVEFLLDKAAFDRDKRIADADLAHLTRSRTAMITVRAQMPAADRALLNSAARVGRSHTGDVITASMPGRFPGLAVNERLRILEVGEEVIPADDPRHRWNLSPSLAGLDRPPMAMTSVPRATPAGGGDAAATPIVVNATLDLGEGIRQRYRIERTREGRTAAIALGAA